MRSPIIELRVATQNKNIQRRSEALSLSDRASNRASRAMSFPSTLASTPAIRASTHHELIRDVVAERVMEVLRPRSATD